MIRQPKTAGFFRENCQNHPDAKVLIKYYENICQKLQPGQVFSVSIITDQNFFTNFSRLENDKFSPYFSRLYRNHVCRVAFLKHFLTAHCRQVTQCAVTQSTKMWLFELSPEGYSITQLENHDFVNILAFLT